MNNDNCFTCAYYMREGICKGECGQTGERVKNSQFTCSIGCYEKMEVENEYKNIQRNN